MLDLHWHRTVCAVDPDVLFRMLFPVGLCSFDDLIDGVGRRECLCHQLHIHK